MTLNRFDIHHPGESKDAGPCPTFALTLSRWGQVVNALQRIVSRR